MRWAVFNDPKRRPRPAVNRRQSVNTTAGSPKSHQIPSRSSLKQNAELLLERWVEQYERVLAIPHRRERYKQLVDLLQNVRQALNTHKTVEDILETVRGRQLMFGMLLNSGLDCDGDSLDTGFYGTTEDVEMKQSESCLDDVERRRYEYFSEALHWGESAKLLFIAAVSAAKLSEFQVALRLLIRLDHSFASSSPFYCGQGRKLTAQIWFLLGDTQTAQSLAESLVDPSNCLKFDTEEALIRREQVLAKHQHEPSVHRETREIVLHCADNSLRSLAIQLLTEFSNDCDNDEELDEFLILRLSVTQKDAEPIVSDGPVDRCPESIAINDELPPRNQDETAEAEESMEDAQSDRQPAAIDARASSRLKSKQQQQQQQQQRQHPNPAIAAKRRNALVDLEMFLPFIPLSADDADLPQPEQYADFTPAIRHLLNNADALQQEPSIVDRDSDTNDGELEQAATGQDIERQRSIIADRLQSRSWHCAEPSVSVLVERLDGLSFPQFLLELRSIIRRETLLASPSTWWDPRYFEEQVDCDAVLAIMFFLQSFTSPPSPIRFIYPELTQRTILITSASDAGSDNKDDLRLIACLQSLAERSLAAINNSGLPYRSLHNHLLSLAVSRLTSLHSNYANNQQQSTVIHRWLNVRSWWLLAQSCRSSSKYSSLDGARIIPALKNCSLALDKLDVAEDTIAKDVLLHLTDGGSREELVLPTCGVGWISRQQISIGLHSLKAEQFFDSLFRTDHQDVDEPLSSDQRSALTAALLPSESLRVNVRSSEIMANGIPVESLRVYYEERLPMNRRLNVLLRLWQSLLTASRNINSNQLAEQVWEATTLAIETACSSAFTLASQLATLTFDKRDESISKPRLIQIRRLLILFFDLAEISRRLMSQLKSGKRTGNVDFRQSYDRILRSYCRFLPLLQILNHQARSLADLASKISKQSLKQLFTADDGTNDIVPYRPFSIGFPTSPLQLGRLLVQLFEQSADPWLAMYYLIKLFPDSDNNNVDNALEYMWNVHGFLGDCGVCSEPFLRIVIERSKEFFETALASLNCRYSFPDRPAEIENEGDSEKWFLPLTECLHAFSSLHGFKLNIERNSTHAVYSSIILRNAGKPVEFGLKDALELYEILLPFIQMHTNDNRLLPKDIQDGLRRIESAINSFVLADKGELESPTTIASIALRRQRLLADYLNRPLLPSDALRWDAPGYHASHINPWRPSDPPVAQKNLIDCLQTFFYLKATVLLQQAFRSENKSDPQRKQSRLDLLSMARSAFANDIVFASTAQSDRLWRSWYGHGLTLCAAIEERLTWSAVVVEEQFDEICRDMRAAFWSLIQAVRAYESLKVSKTTDGEYIGGKSCLAVIYAELGCLVYRMASRPFGGCIAGDILRKMEMRLRAVETGTVVHRSRQRKRSRSGAADGNDEIQVDCQDRREQCTLDSIITIEDFCGGGRRAIIKDQNEGGDDDGNEEDDDGDDDDNEHDIIASFEFPENFAESQSAINPIELRRFYSFSAMCLLRADHLIRSTRPSLRRLFASFQSNTRAYSDTLKEVMFSHGLTADTDASSVRIVLPWRWLWLLGKCSMKLGRPVDETVKYYHSALKSAMPSWLAPTTKQEEDGKLSLDALNDLAEWLRCPANACFQPVPMNLVSSASVGRPVISQSETSSWFYPFYSTVSLLAKQYVLAGGDERRLMETGSGDSLALLAKYMQAATGAAKDQPRLPLFDRLIRALEFILDRDKYFHRATYRKAWLYANTNPTTPQLLCVGQESISSLFQIKSRMFNFFMTTFELGGQYFAYTYRYLMLYCQLLAECCHNSLNTAGGAEPTHSPLSITFDEAKLADFDTLVGVMKKIRGQASMEIWWGEHAWSNAYRKSVRCALQWKDRVLDQFSTAARQFIQSDFKLQGSISRQLFDGLYTTAESWITMDLVPPQENCAPDSSATDIGDLYRRRESTVFVDTMMPSPQTLWTVLRRLYDLRKHADKFTYDGLNELDNAMLDLFTALFFYYGMAEGVVGSRRPSNYGSQNAPLQSTNGEAGFGDQTHIRLSLEWFGTVLRGSQLVLNGPLPTVAVPLFADSALVDGDINQSPLLERANLMPKVYSLAKFKPKPPAASAIEQVGETGGQ